MYFSDDGDLVAVRFDHWKVVFMEQRAPGTLAVWAEPFVALRLPKLYNLRMDPYERADITSNTYYQWLLESGYLVMAASVVVSEFMKTFKDFPRGRRRPASRSTRRWRRWRASAAAPCTERAPWFIDRCTSAPPQVQTVDLSCGDPIRIVTYQCVERPGLCVE